jgi:hypothetical protein
MFILFFSMKFCQDENEVLSETEELLKIFNKVTQL